VTLVASRPARLGPRPPCHAVDRPPHSQPARESRIADHGNRDRRIRTAQTVLKALPPRVPVCDCDSP